MSLSGAHGLLGRCQRGCDPHHSARLRSRSRHFATFRALIVWRKIPAVWFQPSSVSEAHPNFTAFLAIGPQSVSLTDEDGGRSGTNFRQVDCHSDLTQTGFARKHKHTLDTSLQRGFFHLASIKPYRPVLTMRPVAAFCPGPLATG